MRALRLILDTGEIRWAIPPADEGAERDRLAELATLALSLSLLPETPGAPRPVSTFRSLRSDPTRWTEVTGAYHTDRQTILPPDVSLAVDTNEAGNGLSPWIVAAIGLIVTGTVLAIPMLESRFPILGQFLAGLLF